MSDQSETPQSNGQVDPRVFLIVAQMGAGVMVLALLLPWLSQFFMSESYLSLAVKTVKFLSTLPAESWDLCKSGNRESVFWLVCFATPALGGLAAAGSALASLGKGPTSESFGALIGAGVMGLLATGGFYYACCAIKVDSGALGMGFYLFAVASLVVLGAAAGGRAAEK
jgi:hypothetical protein